MPRRWRSARDEGNQWDYLALVYYPSVAAFIDMMTSADYETRCDPHRTQWLRGACHHLHEGSLQQVQGVTDPTVVASQRVVANAQPDDRLREAIQLRWP